MISTGNEYIAIPEIEPNSDVLSINVLSMERRGMIEFRGRDKPFLSLTLTIDGKSVILSERSKDRYWIPEFGAANDTYDVHSVLIAPRNQKGFVQTLTIQNKGTQPCSVALHLEGAIDEILHTVNESKRFEGSLHAYQSSWSECPCFDIRLGFPVLAIAPICSGPSVWTYTEGETITFAMHASFDVEAGAEQSYSLFWGVGYEEVSAVTTARELSRQGFDVLLSETRSYLDSIIRISGDEHLDRCLFKNLLFSIYYATGKTIDTEELVLVTSRSPRYYVSAAYWDRDALLWSFPAILEVDEQLAREMLFYASTKQKRNVGTHSRYIDGTVLEPGFELDELCAPILAIEAYREKTGEPVLEDENIQSLIDLIILKLHAVETETGLYKTFLQPTDDMHVYPLLTYDNALVYRAFSILAIWDWKGKKGIWQQKSEQVKQAMEKHLVKYHEGKKQYIWSTDGQGNFDIYDEPPGSLLLLPLFGVTSLTDEAYRNTVSAITNPAYAYAFAGTKYSAIGCPHAPHPWILSLANKVRMFQDKDALEKLLSAPMDHGIACESIDEHTGYSTTGEAFATCAGYLSYVLIGELKARGKWKTH